MRWRWRYIKRARARKEAPGARGGVRRRVSGSVAQETCSREVEVSIADMGATRVRKDREFSRLQRNLMELPEQKYELVREKRALS